MCDMCGKLSIHPGGFGLELRGSGSYYAIGYEGFGGFDLDRERTPEELEDYDPWCMGPEPDDDTYAENRDFLRALYAMHAADEGSLPPDTRALVHWVAWCVSAAVGIVYTRLYAPLTGSEIGPTYEDYDRALACAAAHPELFPPVPRRRFEE